jgi:hypothetical protein
VLPTDSPGERLLDRLEKAWRELGDSYVGLSETELTRPGAAGNWSVKDVIAHVTTWEEEALKHLPTVISGRRPPRYASEGGIDAFNARTAERKAGLSLDAVLEQRDDTHRRLVEFVRSLPSAGVASPRVVRRLRLDTFGHYTLHAEAIRAWRAHNL